MEYRSSMRTVWVCCATAASIAAADAGEIAFPAPAALPTQQQLPDPLKMFDGRRIVAAEAWEKERRPELKALIEHYMYGAAPAATKVGAKILREDPRALAGEATLKEVLLQMAPAPAPPVHLLLVTPNRRSGPAPVFVGLNFCGNYALLDDPAIRLPTAWMYPGKVGVVNNRATEAGRGAEKEVWAIDQSIHRGYAVALFYTGEIVSDRPDARDGLRPFVDKQGKTGAIALWAWGAQRVVDYLSTQADFDPKRIAVVGHSRLGKAALLAAALDERIALAIAHQAGCGGTAPSRGKIGESVKKINTGFPQFFNATFKQFNDAPERLPFDQNCVTALIAPRPVLFSNAVEDLWANPAGQFDVLKAAEPVWRLLHTDGLAAPTPPVVGELSAGNLGYYIRPGKHSMTRGDWKTFLDYADAHFGKPGAAGSTP